MKTNIQDVKAGEVVFTTNGHTRGPQYGIVYRDYSEQERWIGASKRHDTEGTFNKRTFDRLQHAKDYAVRLTD